MLTSVNPSWWEYGRQLAWLKCHWRDFTPRPGLQPLQASQILSWPLPSQEKMRRENIQLQFFFDTLLFFLPIFMYMISY